MRWIRIFSVRRIDQRSGFRIPSLTMACRLSISTTMAYWTFLIEMSHLGSWLHVTCHLSAQYECVDSFKEYGLVAITLVYYPEERVCLP
jgi:hypothetical protein